MGLINKDVLLPDEEEIGVEKLCPVCHINYIGEDEEICFICQKEREEKANAKPDDWDYDAERETEDDAVADDLDDMVLTESEDMPDEEDGDEYADQYKEPDDFDFDVKEEDFLDDDDDDDEELDDEEDDE